MEGDDEIKGEGNSYDFGARMYDSRVGRWLSQDPVKVAYMSPYVFVSNDPIRYYDPTGEWQTDGHYWTVFLIAVMLDLPNAQEIAYYAEYPDTKIHGNVATERYTWILPFIQQYTHSLTGQNGPTASVHASAAILREDENPENVKEVGRLIHLLGDTYAHRKIDGNGELYGVKGGIFTVDHAASDGETPDLIGNRPKLYLEYVGALSTVLRKKYGEGENSNFDIGVFERLANYAKNNNETPTSLLGILNYEVAKAQGNNSFVVHKVQSILPTNEAYQTQVANTKTYLDSQGISYTTNEVYKRSIETTTDPHNPGMTKSKTEKRTLIGTRFNIQK